MNKFFVRNLAITNKIKANDEDKGDFDVVEFFLRSMTAKFDYVICFIEESMDINTLIIDELQSNLLIHEQQ